MATALRDLWPDATTNVDVLSPLAILKYQAGKLRQRTGSLLEAEIDSDVSAERSLHRFIVIAPALNGYRLVLFTATHNPKQVYPAQVYGECFEDDFDNGWRQASTQDEFLHWVGEILKSPDVQSVIQSLIAQSNEANGAAGNGATSDESPEQ